MDCDQTRSRLWRMLATGAVVLIGAVEIASAQSQAGGPPPPPASSPAKLSDEPKTQSGGGSVVQILTKSTSVVVATGRQSCNGSGHLVYLTNHNLLPITARLDVVED